MILSFISYLPWISTRFIVTYHNAEFNPFDMHSIIDNLTLIDSRNFCICQCFMNSLCNTVTYNGLNQYCVLYFAYLQEGELQTTAIDTNSTVISLRDMSSTGNNHIIQVFYIITRIKLDRY